MGRKRTKLKKRTKKMFVKFFGDKENIWVLGPVTIIPSLIDNRLELQIRNGFWRYYHKNGQVAHSGRYNDGVLSLIHI